MSNRSLLLALMLLTAGCVTLTPPRGQKPSESAVVIHDVPLRSWGDEACGAGALSTVLNHFGDPVTEAQLDRLLPKARGGGVVSLDLLLEARHRGFDAALTSGTHDAIVESLRGGNPAILMISVMHGPGKALDFYHYIVVDGFDPAKDLFRMQLGDAAARWLPLAKLNRAWAETDHAMILVRRKAAGSEQQLDARSALRRGVELETEGKVAQAAELYRQIVASEPSNAIAWTNLGNVEVSQQHSKEAEEAYRRALASDPDNGDALNNLAWLLFQQKRLDEAETLARRAVALRGPDAYLVLDTLGEILASRGACDEAVTALSTALGQSPSDAKARLYLSLGTVQRDCGRHDDALRSLNAALDASPDPTTAADARAAIDSIAK
jgi:Tfp pilus assembly protein PilF